MYFSLTNNEMPKVKDYVKGVIPLLFSSTIKSHFRMSETTFEVILNYLAPCPEFQKHVEELGGQQQISIGIVGVSNSRKLPITIGVWETDL